MGNDRKHVNDWMLLISVPVPLCSDLSSNQLSSLPLIGLQSLTHLRLAGNTQLMELIPREDLPRVR